MEAETAAAAAAAAAAGAAAAAEEEGGKPAAALSDAEAAAAAKREKKAKKKERQKKKKEEKAKGGAAAPAADAAAEMEDGEGGLPDLPLHLCTLNRPVMIFLAGAAPCPSSPRRPMSLPPELLGRVTVVDSLDEILAKKNISQLLRWQRYWDEEGADAALELESRVKCFK